MVVKMAMKSRIFFVNLLNLFMALSVVSSGVNKETNFCRQFVKPFITRVCPSSTENFPLPIPKPTTQTLIFDKYRADLHELVKKYLEQGLLNVAILIVDQDSKEAIEINPDQIFETASLYKLFVLWKLQLEINAGTLTDATEIPVVEYIDETDLSSPFYSASFTTVGDARTAMITYSDNTAAWSLANILGWKHIDDMLIAYTFANSHINEFEPTTNARDITRFFQGIYNQNLDANLTKADYMLMLDLLKKQMVNIYLPQGLPENVVFAHKTGTLNGYNHDAGILYGPKGNVFFIAVLTEGDSSAFMKEVGQLTWQAMLKMPLAINPHNLFRY